MKILKRSLIMVAASALLFSCKQSSNEQNDTNAENINTEVTSDEIAGTIQKASFQIEGMSCAIGCANVIEKKLANLAGVQLASVDFESKTAVVEFDDAKQNAESITKTVEEIANGAYTVENLIVSKDLAVLE